jgi:hypothetical protein
MSASAKQPRTRVHVRLSAQTRKLLKEHAVARGISERAVLEAALNEHFHDVGDSTLVMRRLDRLGRAIGRLQRDNEISMEALMIFVKFWFAHTPAIEDENKRAAQGRAEARYKQFVAYVNDLLARGHRAFDDFPREPLADRTELAALAGGDPPAAPTR